MNQNNEETVLTILMMNMFKKGRVYFSYFLKHKIFFEQFSCDKLRFSNF